LSLPFLPLPTVIPPLILTWLYIGVLIVARELNEDENASTFYVSIGTFIGVLLGYMAYMVLVFNFHPGITYITKNGVADGFIITEAHESFYVLLLFEGGLLAISGVVLSQSIQPEHGYARINYESWKTYGTWIGTFFGAIGISAALAFITNATEFGNIFIKHIILFFGSIVLLNMFFIIYKLTQLEKEAATESKEKHYILDQSPPESRR
jgi:hypothetical protein